MLFYYASWNHIQMSFHTKEDWIHFLINSGHSIQQGTAYKEQVVKKKKKKQAMPKAGMFQSSSPSASDVLMVKLRNKMSSWPFGGERKPNSRTFYQLGKGQIWENKKLETWSKCFIIGHDDQKIMVNTHTHSDLIPLPQVEGPTPCWRLRPRPAVLAPPRALPYPRSSTACF